MRLTIETRQAVPDITVLELKGFLTLGNQLLDAERSLATMIEQGPKKIIFDMGEVEMIDSAGVGLLLLCAGVSERVGGEMRIARPNARVGQIFEITHLAQIVPIHQDLDLALESF